MIPNKLLLTGTVVVVAFAVSVFIFRFFSTPFLILKNGDTGEGIASYPVKDGEEFSVTFVHSVNNSPVTDVYQIRGGKIYVVRTIYYAFGAGVQTEVDEGQSLAYGKDGSMIVSGFDRLIDPLSYIVGTVSDHTLKISGRGISLRELCGKNTTVRFAVGRRISFHTLRRRFLCLN